MNEANYAYIDPAFPDVIIERRTLDPTTIPEHKRHLWRPIVIVNENPDHNRLTQRVTGPITTIEPEKVVDTYKVVNYSQKELEENKDKAVVSELGGGTGYAVLSRVLLDLHNRVLVLEGKNPISFAEFVAMLKGTL